MFALRHLFTHYYVILIFQIDDGRQMVTVTVQPSPAPMRTQGGTFVFAILLNQIIADENFIVIIRLSSPASDICVHPAPPCFHPSGRHSYPPSR